MRAAPVPVLICIVVSLTACRDDGGLNDAAMARFMADSAAVAAFEARGVPLGTYAMPAMIAWGAHHIGRSFADVADLYARDYQIVELMPGATYQAGSGPHLVRLPYDSAAGGQPTIGRMEIRHQGTEPAFVIAEGLDENGRTVGVSQAPSSRAATWYTSTTSRP